MTPEQAEPIPGFTPEQSWAMKVVAKEAADQAADRVAENIKKDLAGHHATLYGDDGRGGLCAAVQEMQTTVRASRKLAWAAVGAAIGAVPAGVLSVILFFASRGG